MTTLEDVIVLIKEVGGSAQIEIRTDTGTVNSSVDQQSTTALLDIEVVEEDNVEEDNTVEEQQKTQIQHIDTGDTQQEVEEEVITSESECKTITGM